MKRLARWTMMVLAGVMLAAALAFHLLTIDLPAPDDLHTRASSGSTKILDRNGQLLYEINDPRSGSRNRLSLLDIPLACQQATIATEDANFTTNSGIDLHAIARALFQNAQSGEIVSGGSTITQQLARMLLLSDEERSQRTVIRKLRESILAVRITDRFSKDDILTLYFNEVYYGNMAYGLEAAAQSYFGTSARNLDLAQCALLAGLPQMPAQYNPLIDLEAARARQKIVLGLMVEQGYLDRSEADRAAAEPLKFRSSAALIAPHFVVYVRHQLETVIGADELPQGEWIITTTLDLDLQRAAEAAVTRHLAELRDHEVSSASVVVIDPRTGEILAMVGSADYTDSSIDGAVNAATSLRQPGSAMKPILYALAFERGWSPGDVVYDVPTSFVDESGETYVPSNYDNLFHGPVSLRQALANSYNLPAVILQKRIGTDDFLEEARRFGLNTLADAKRYGLTLTLGGGEVRLLDLTSAYAVFAREGEQVTPCSIKAISSREVHSSLFTFQTCSESAIKNLQSKILIDPRAVYLLTDALSDNAARADQFGLFSPLRLPFPAAAKTGTTSNYRDNWTLGYTPQRVVGVWVGNPNGRPMSHISGVDGAGPIWHAVMLAAQQQLPIESFVEPPGIDRREVCITNGLTPGPDCPYRRTELYLAESPVRSIEDDYARVADQLVWYAPAELRDWARTNDVAFAIRDQNPPEGSKPPGGYVPRLISPAPNTHILIDPHVPLNMQQLEVIVRVNDEAAVARIDFMVDGKAWASTQDAPYRAWWTLSAGEHRFAVIVIDRSGKQWQGEVVSVSVEQ
jgi:penicillin-binding protein 1C